MTVTEALKLIVKYQDMKALNYAVNYAKYALQIADQTGEEFRVQCLYVASNLSSWRATKSSSVTKEQIKEARKAIKDAAGMK